MGEFGTFLRNSLEAERGEKSSMVNPVYANSGANGSFAVVWKEGDFSPLEAYESFCKGSGTVCIP